MTWQEVVISEISNVRKGKEEANESTEQVDRAIEFLKTNPTENEAKQKLVECGLGYFAGVLHEHIYHDRAEAE